MSTIDLKEIKFKELSAAVVALNNSECFKGKEKIATVGVSKIALVEAFLAAVENVPDNEKGEWTGPQVAGDYYNKIVVVEDPGAIVEVVEKDVESENETEEIAQTEEDTLFSKIEDHELVEHPGIIAKEIPKVKKEKKVYESSKEKDEFGFVKGSNRSLFCESLKETPGTMKEICARGWNKGKSLYNETFKIIEAKGLAKKDAKTGILSIK